MAQHYSAAFNNDAKADRDMKSSAATATPIPTPASDRLSFFEARRAAKWHRQLTALTLNGSVRPVNRTYILSEAHAFPFAAAHALTKTFLGRTKSQADTDRRLLTLIAIHAADSSELAFAACARHLSIESVHHVLATRFEAASDRPAGIEPYLQAFAAAAQAHPHGFAARDVALAAALVGVADDAGVGVSAGTLRTLVAGWRAAGLPRAQGLRARAVSLTATVMHNVRAKLERCREVRAWVVAGEYREALLGLEAAFVAAGPVLRGCVRAFFPQWWCWTAWRPDWRVLDALERMRGGEIGERFACLRELEGPDEGDGDEGDVKDTMWQGMIQRRQLLAWLERSGFKVGVGLIVGDTQSLVLEFMEAFRRWIMMASAGGSAAVWLLELYIDREGLDCHALTTWEDARRLLLNPLPAFVEMLRDPHAVSKHNDADVIVEAALKALAPSLSLNSMRRPIQTEVSRVVQHTLEKLDTDLRVSMPLLELDYEWLKPALRLWGLRDVLAASPWLHAFVDANLVQRSQTQPPKSQLQSLKALHAATKESRDAELLRAVNDYISSYVLDGDVHGAPLVEALHTCCTTTMDRKKREAALMLAQLEKVPVDVRCSCIVALADETSAVADLVKDRISQLNSGVTAAYMDLTDLVATLTGPLHVQVCWAALLWALFKTGVVFVDQHVFTDKGYAAYAKWIRQLHVLFGGKVCLCDDMHAWLERLEPFAAVLQALDSKPDAKRALHRLLTTTEGSRATGHLEMLGIIHHETRPDRKSCMLALLDALRASNTRAVRGAIGACASLYNDKFTALQQLIDLARKNKDLAAARLVIWLNMSEYSPMLKAALIDVGDVFSLRDSGKAWETAQQAARQHYEARMQGILARAKILESKRVTLLRTQRVEVEDMMRGLKLEVPQGVAAVMAELPAELVDVVEEVADDRLEMHFGLSHLHSLTKLALGVQGTETVVVSLRTFGAGVVDGFCVHVEDSVGPAADEEHSWTEMGEVVMAPPTRFQCRGKRTRLEFVVARTVWRTLRDAEELDVPKLYARVKEVILSGANECVHCGTSIGARRHRATRCWESGCNLRSSEVDFCIKTEMLGQDTRVMDLLLTAAYAVAATSKNMDLLPAVPDSCSKAHRLVTLLNNLPSTAMLAKAADMQSMLQSATRNADLFTAWLCNASRTFIISATGHWRIPNMPGIHQFLVVDNPPGVEAAFAAHNHLQPRMVLFHGTSMDRLYAILAQGMRVLSNTPLMKNGAASGSGIYFSTETSLPASYAAAAAPKKVAWPPRFFESRPDFHAPQVLLGCEHAGPATKGDIFVVRDPSKVIVRYIFLVPPGVPVPVAKDIVAPMVSTFYSLRASAAVSK